MAVISAMKAERIHAARIPRKLSRRKSRLNRPLSILISSAGSVRGVVLRRKLKEGTLFP
jgi:hypothetical protein